MKKLFTIFFALSVTFSSIAFSGEIQLTKELNKSKTSKVLITTPSSQASLLDQNSSNNNYLKIESLPEIKLTITQPVNWYLILLPIATIVIVIGGTFVTLRQLKLRTDESINTFNKTINKQMELSKAEIKLEVLSKNRQAWINTLRDELSKFIGEAIHLVNYDGSDKDMRLSVKNVMEIRAKIRLLINPTEPNHQKLIVILEQVLKKVKDAQPFSEDIEELVKISQVILKEEWVRVKNLD